jgi:hypothetical protein
MKSASESARVGYQYIVGIKVFPLRVFSEFLTKAVISRQALFLSDVIVVARWTCPLIVLAFLKLFSTAFIYPVVEALHVQKSIAASA